MELSLLCYNIHKGFSVRKRAFVLEQMRHAIRETAADLVFLQEVIGVHSGHRERHEDWPDEEQFEYLADTVWPHFAYGKNAIYPEGHHGNAVLSKYPITGHDNFDISHGKYEQRGILHCRVELPRGPLDCYCTHLGLFHWMRRYQFEKICEWVEATSVEGAPILLGGDFNDWRQGACDVLTERLSVREAHRDAHGHLARTFPSWLPMLKLDRVYSRGVTVRTSQVLRGSPWNVLSDHSPLLVKFDLLDSFRPEH